MMIIEILRDVHGRYRLNDGDVSAHTKSAQRVTKEWQRRICNETIQSEVKVSPENNEKFDVVDFSKRIAYELKVSGKNTHHEFYKDIVKVLTYNEYKSENEKLNKLTFISEAEGIQSLKGRLDTKFIAMLKKAHGISIELVSI